MRQIKFRAWHKKAKEMLFGTNENTFRWQAEGQPIELMQFTGLKDKNGKEIYEGDIVTYQQAERFGESVSDYRTIVKYEEYGFTPMKYHSECEDGFYSCLISDIEVIGNIYENPDLLP